jgi:hypothetical protein
MGNLVEVAHTKEAYRQLRNKTYFKLLSSLLTGHAVACLRADHQFLCTLPDKMP